MGCGTQYAFELLTRQFYEWEIRGRGWRVWPRPVMLEPPFRPFFGHFLEGTSPIVDDGRKQTRLSSIFERLKPPPNNALTLPVAVEPPLEFFDDGGPLAEIQIALPPETKVTRDTAAQFLLTLGHTSRPASFEIVGTSESIVVQLTCAKRDERQVCEQLQAYFPEAIVTAREGFLASLWEGAGKQAVVDFGLSNEFMRPLRSYERFEPDPLSGVMGAMSDLVGRELAVLQVLFAPTRHPWPENIMRAVSDSEGGSFFADDPSIAKLAAAKVAKPLFATVVRVAAQSPQEDRGWRIAENIGNSLRQFIDSPSNELIPLTNDEYDNRQHAADVVARRSCRSGMLVNSDELMSIAHLPSASARSPKLKREERRTKAPPALALGHELVLGENYHAGKTLQVTLGHEQRVRHMHLIGASGSGKSTLLLSELSVAVRKLQAVAPRDPVMPVADGFFG